jgi:hypothetical protein
MKIRMGSITGSSFIKAVGFSGAAGDNATLRIQFDDALLDFAKVPFSIFKAWFAAKTRPTSTSATSTELTLTRKFDLPGEPSIQSGHEFVGSGQPIGPRWNRISSFTRPARETRHGAASDPPTQEVPHGLTEKAPSE